jgi:phage terminase small subunit
MLTPKQESFCLAYIESGNASEAYRRAYNAGKMKPRTIAVKASELLKNGKVTVRLEGLRADHLSRHNVTIDVLTRELEADRQLARGKDQAGAAINATKVIARIHGFLDQPRAINFDMPAINDIGDVLAGIARVVEGLTNGQLTPVEAGKITDQLEKYRRIVHTDELAGRIAALEAISKD